VALIIIIALFIYSFFPAANNESEKNLAATGGVAESEGAGSFSEGEEILTILKRLKSVKMDVDFFENKIFKSLSDFSVKINPEPVGRNNPFAPI
jgi:hypothetical protein